MPRARTDRVVVQELPDEMLIYDLDRDQAHCLNRAAAVVWRHCDGRTSVADLARRLKDEADLPADEAVVWLALQRLAKTHLLEAGVVPQACAARCTRRDVLRKLGAAAGLAALLPAVQSIVAPEAAQAASGTTSAACSSNPGANNGKCCTDVSPKRLCRNIFGFGFCFGSLC